jgi:hypothetical protein
MDRISLANMERWYRLLRFVMCIFLSLLLVGVSIAFFVTTSAPASFLFMLPAASYFVAAYFAMRGNRIGFAAYYFGPLILGAILWISPQL